MYVSLIWSLQRHLTILNYIYVHQVYSATLVVYLFKGQQGNLTERVTSSVASFLLLAPVFFGVIYFLLWQTYVFYIDVVIVAIELAFIALELVFSLVCMITFCR